MLGKPRNAFENLIAGVLTSRTIKAKSLIMTIFGDAVVPRGGQIWLGSLVKLASEFGLQEPMVRTSALRLSKEGWLNRKQDGKFSYYSMSGTYFTSDIAFQRQIYSPADVLRRSGWTIVHIFGNQLDRSEHYLIRKHFQRFGFGRMTPHVYLHPSLAPEAVHYILNASSKDGLAGVTFYNARCERNSQHMRELAKLAWDLDEIRDGYEKFIATFRPLPHLLAKARPQPNEAFRLRTLIINEYRRLALRDPRLPEKLCGSKWPGEQAYRLAGLAYQRLLESSEAHLDVNLTTPDGLTLPADHRLYDRFSGLTI